MNKKQYIQPTMQVVELQQAQVLCASGKSVHTTGLSESLDYGDGETKEKSIWDAF